MIGLRIKTLRTSKGMSINGLAKELGISPGNLSDIEKDKNLPSTKASIRISEYFSVALDWLLTGKGNMFVADEQPIYNKECNNQQTCVNVVGKIAAGTPIPIDNDEPLYCVNIDQHMLPKGNILCFEAQGDSMSPKIEDGDLIFIEKTVDWLNSNGKICAVRVDGECTLKIVELQDKYVMLHPINHTFKTQIIDTEVQEITMVGKMVLHIQNTKNRSYL